MIKPFLNLVNVGLFGENLRGGCRSHQICNEAFDFDVQALWSAVLKRCITEQSLGLHGPGLFYALRTLKACDHWQAFAAGSRQGVSMPAVPHRPRQARRRQRRR